MNRRSFLGLLAAAPIAAVAPKPEIKWHSRLWVSESATEPFVWHEVPDTNFLDDVKRLAFATRHITERNVAELCA